MPDVFDAMYDMLNEHITRHGPGIDREFRAASDAYDAIQATARDRWSLPAGVGKTSFHGVPIVADPSVAPGVVYVWGRRSASWPTEGMAGIVTGNVACAVSIKLTGWSPENMKRALGLE